MGRKISLQLDVELDQAVHGDSDCNRFEKHGPKMGVKWRERVFAQDIVFLGKDRDDREEDADKAVLENGNPDDLCSWLDTTRLRVNSDTRSA